MTRNCTHQRNRAVSARALGIALAAVSLAPAVAHCLAARRYSWRGQDADRALKWLGQARRVAMSMTNR
jgi:hypothetical protein